MEGLDIPICQTFIQQAVAIFTNDKVGPGGYCPPRHMLSFSSSDEGSKCVG